MDQLNYFDQDNELRIKKITIRYKPEKAQDGAALNFHLSAREQKDIVQSFYSSVNKVALDTLCSLLKP